MCTRDLRAYTPGFGNHLSYYHDRYGLEADLVLHLDDGRYALIECKLGSREIEDGSKHLLEIKRLIQEHNKTEKQVPLRKPDLLIAVTVHKKKTAKINSWQSKKRIRLYYTSIILGVCLQAESSRKRSVVRSFR